METQDAVMTTQQVADRYSELVKQYDWTGIQSELFSDDAESIEPAHAMGMQNAKGKEAIKKKGEEFGAAVEEMHGGYCSEPVVGGNYFAVSMGMDVTMKGVGRTKVDEIAVYEVKDGKITKEQFFY